jgi:hypothetical protein
VIQFRGVLPSGETDQVDVRVAAIMPFLVMKAMAMDGRIKNKDPYDIYYCLTHYPLGMEGIIEEFRPHRNNALVKQAIEKIGTKFSSIDDYGPRSVPEAGNITDPTEREIMARTSFERINDFLRKVQPGK